ncbi:MAG: ABC transporter ATP-binding protein [Terriglobales bacterium]
MSPPRESSARMEVAGAVSGAAAADAVIRLEHVSLEFDGTPVLTDVSLAVRHGETKVLLGESGAGKSVLMKLVLGLLRPNKGQVWVFGQEVSAMPEAKLFELRRRIGMTFQESALFDSLSVRDNVAYRLEEDGRLTDEAMDERVRTCLKFVNLDDVMDKMPAELSGGMRHRVSIARALATSPEIMLYDSPTGGLDPETATTIMDLIIKLRDNNRVTALLATHRLQDGYLLATHAWDSNAGAARWAPEGARHTSFLLLRQGRVLFDGTAEELRGDPDPYVRQFLA